MTDSNPSSDSSVADVQSAPQPVERDRAMINEARQQGIGSLFWAFTKLSGPGWLQSAITLGGGSLGGSLYLGVLAGFGMMWWQPMAMILGVIMLSAIGYVALSTGRRPFDAINEHVSPVLGWGWAIGTMMANMIWCMPQFGLGVAAMQQNLFPSVLGTQALGETNGKLVCIAILFVLATIVIWFYDRGGKGIAIFEMILKGMVAIVVLSFFGVVIKMLASGSLSLAAVFDGFTPRINRLFEPSPAFDSVLTEAGAYGSFWSSQIVDTQQKAMITAVATAVGINMTFLLPYSMLSKGWDKDFRGLAIFDLSTGLFIPYLLATSCVVIAAATQFHGADKPAHQGLIQLYESPEKAQNLRPGLISGYEKLLDSRLAVERGDEYASLSDAEKKDMRAALPEADRTVAAMIVQRDAKDLAGALEALVGKGMAQIVFGVGVLGMAISTIIILMLINGFVVCEMFNLPHTGWAHRGGALLAGLSGATGPFVFTGPAKFWLVVPTSMFGMTLLPVAYWTFLFLFNSKTLMGENRPTGGKLVAWNIAMIIAASIATILCLWAIYLSNTPVVGFTILAVFVSLAVLTFLMKPKVADADASGTPTA